MRTKLAGFVRTLRDNGFTVGLAETRTRSRSLPRRRPRVLRRSGRRSVRSSRPTIPTSSVSTKFSPPTGPGAHVRRASESGRGRDAGREAAAPGRLAAGAALKEPGTPDRVSAADGCRGRPPKAAAAPKARRAPRRWRRPTSATSSTLRRSPRRMRSPSGWRGRCARASSAASGSRAQRPPARSPPHHPQQHLARRNAGRARVAAEET